MGYHQDCCHNYAPIGGVGGPGGGRWAAGGRAGGRRAACGWLAGGPSYLAPQLAIYPAIFPSYHK